MGTIHNFARNLDKLTLFNEGAVAVAKTEQGVRLLQESQLVFTGKNKENKTLKRYKSSSYARMKNEMNPFPGYGNPDLKKTGALLRGLKIINITQHEFDIISTDAKYPELLKKYGKEMFGLNKDSIVDYKKKYFQTEFVAQVKKTLKL